MLGRRLGASALLRGRWVAVLGMCRGCRPEQPGMEPDPQLSLRQLPAGSCC